MVILENIDIDIDKAILQNIDIDKILNRFKFGISNRASTVSQCPAVRTHRSAIRVPLHWPIRFPSGVVLWITSQGNCPGYRLDEMGGESLFWKLTVASIPPPANLLTLALLIPHRQGLLFLAMLPASLLEVPHDDCLGVLPEKYSRYISSQHIQVTQL